MPRPAVNHNALCDEIVATAETLLKETSGKRLVFSDVSDRMGVSQSYVYKFFKNKDALVAELARRWFEKVEQAGEEISSSNLPWQQLLRSHILTTLALKKNAYQDDPQLFATYLNLASTHEALVVQHTRTLADQLRRVLDSGFSSKNSNTDKMLEILLDATVQFRVPHAILNAPNNAAPERANQILDVIIDYFEKEL